MGAGDEDFERFFDESFRRAFLVAHRIVGEAAQAEDVAAEAFIRAYARWPRLGEDPKRVGWVVRVTVNLAIDVTRRRVRLMSGHPADAEDETVVLRLALVEALRRLPERQRQAVALRFLADMSEADVAAALGVSTGAVKSHVHRGVSRLKTLLAAADDHDVEVRLGVEPD